MFDAVRERRLARKVAGFDRPRHLGVLLDVPPPPDRVPASITDLLAWCHECGIEIVTLWLRPTASTQHRVVEMLATAAPDLLRRNAPYTPHFIDPAGLLPFVVAAPNGGRPIGRPVTIAIGYDGHDEVTQAVRAALAVHAKSGLTLGEAADALALDDITSHVYTSGYPDPDLIIRTSNRHRLDSFLLWQAARSEFWFHRRRTSRFRKVDFLAALRDYGTRHRRYGA